MTCYNCDRCGRYKHLSRMAEYEVKKRIGRLTVKTSIWLCKWCLTKAGIKYSTEDDWIYVHDKNEDNYDWRTKEIAKMKKKENQRIT